MNSHEFRVEHPVQPDSLSDGKEAVEDVDGRGSFASADHLGGIHSSELPGYIELLLGDDVNKFRSMDPARLGKYIHGQFEYKSMTLSCEYRHEATETLEIPFNIAAGYCATEILKEFVAGGTDATRVDVGSANILHVLSICAAERYRPEEDYVNICNMLIEDVLTEYQFRSLCLQENSDGLRPLELASKLGTFGIFRSLLLRRGYICGQSRPKGMSTVCPYDISVYEDCQSFRRLLRCPLRYMVYVNKEGLQSLSQYKILELPVMRKWIQKKIKSAIWVLSLWWFVRISFIAFVSFLDPNINVFRKMCDNYTFPEKKPSFDDDPSGASRFIQCRKMMDLDPFKRDFLLAASEFTWYWSVLMVAFDTAEFVLMSLHRDRRRAYGNIYGRTYVIYTPAYRISQFICYVLNVVAVPVSQSMHGGEASTVLLYIKASQLPLCLMSLCYVVEFLPMLGIFAITLQQMLKSMAVFILFLFPVKILFSTFFMYFDDSGKFTELISGIYHLFLIDIGSMDFGENPRLLIQFVHIFYFFAMTILLFNYLIALLSIVAEDVKDYKPVFVNLRRLQMIHHVDERFAFWLWKFLYKFVERKPVVIFAASLLLERDR